MKSMSMMNKLVYLNFKIGFLFILFLNIYIYII